MFFVSALLDGLRPSGLSLALAILLGFPFGLAFWLLFSWSRSLISDFIFSILFLTRCVVAAIVVILIIRVGVLELAIWECEVIAFRHDVAMELHSA